MEVISSPAASRPARSRKKPRCRTCLQTVEGHKLHNGRRVCPQKATPRTNPYPRPRLSPAPSASGSSSSDPLLLSSPKWSPARSIRDELSPQGWKPEKPGQEASAPNRSATPEMTALERMLLDRLKTPDGFGSDTSDSDSDSGKARTRPASSHPRITVPRPAKSPSTSVSGLSNDAARKDNTLRTPNRKLGDSPHRQHLFDMYNHLDWVPNHVHYKNLQAAGIICYHFLDPEHASRVPTNEDDLAIHQSIMRGIVVPWLKKRNSMEGEQLLKRISVVYDGDGFEADLGVNSARSIGVRLSASDIIEFGARSKKDVPWRGKGQWYRRRKSNACRRWMNNGQPTGTPEDDEQDLTRTTPNELFAQWMKYHMTAAQRAANPDWFFTGDYPDKATARKALLAWLAEVGDERGLEDFPEVLDSPLASPIVGSSPLSPVEARGGSVDSDKLEYLPPTPPPERPASGSSSDLPTPPTLSAEQLKMLRLALLSIPPDSRGSMSSVSGLLGVSTSAPHISAPRPSPATDMEHIQRAPLTPAESPTKAPSPMPEVFFTPPLIPQELDDDDTVMQDAEDIQPATPTGVAPTPAPESAPTETLPEPMAAPTPAPAPVPGFEAYPTLLTLLPALPGLSLSKDTQPPWCLYVHPTTASQLNSATAEAHKLGLSTGVLFHPSSPDSDPLAPWLALSNNAATLQSFLEIPQRAMPGAYVARIGPHGPCRCEMHGGFGDPYDEGPGLMGTLAAGAAGGLAMWFGLSRP
ncbi:hypothetical protein DENSPDRAFT_846935 [Dentipellis sp. KUC8613]|nr:hypothetical protein DENSPDRAFT_846935 [Dentipellis sp. KUC8613]